MCESGKCEDGIVVGHAGGSVGVHETEHVDKEAGTARRFSGGIFICDERWVCDRECVAFEWWKAFGLDIAHVYYKHSRWILLSLVSRSQESNVHLKSIQFLSVNNAHFVLALYIYIIKRSSSHSMQRTRNSRARCMPL